MQKNNCIKKVIRLIIFIVIIFVFNLNGHAQVSIGGPACAVTGMPYSYVLSAYYSGTSNYSYNISGGTLSTGGTTGTHSGPGAVSVIITWTSSGSITLNSPAGYSVYSITMTAAFAAGSITSGQSQNINYNTIPATINCALASGGTCTTPSYVYQWQQSPDNVNYANINGATLQNLAFATGATQTFYYRRFVTETTANNTGYSTVASVILNPPNPILPVSAGSISPGTQYINYNTPSAVLSSTGVSGGTYTYNYQWQSSPDNSNWTNISCSATAYSPGSLIATTYYRLAVTSNGATSYSTSAVLNVYPQLKVPVITPSSINITSGGNPGSINCSVPMGGNGSYTYQWQSSTDGINFPVNIASANARFYTPGILSVNTWYRLMITSNGVIVYSNVAQVAIVSGSPDVSFIRERDVVKPGVQDSAVAGALTSVYDVSQTTQYFDGFGRQTQTVAMQQSPLQHDLVSIAQYDAFGRQTLDYLPYVTSTSDGNYKNTAIADQYNFNSASFPGEQYYYGQVNYESSPLNRVTTTMASGLNWCGSGRGITSQYQLNTTSDSVRIWSIAAPAGSIPSSTSMYMAGTLFKNLSIDEAGHQMVEYKDMDGKTILKKVQLAALPGTAYAGWLCTYYVYDIMGNLRFVIQPLALQLINSNWTITSGIADELCFRYEYDQRHRMIIKKVPGAGETWMVYDARNRLVMTQDANLRQNNTWMTTIFDLLNRPVQTGIYWLTATSTFAGFQTAASTSNGYPYAAPTQQNANWEPLVQTFYDDYSWVAAEGNILPITRYTGDDGSLLTASNTTAPYPQPLIQSAQIRGMITGTKMKIIGSAQVLLSTIYYDDRARVLQTYSYNITGGVTVKTNQYSFSGQVLATYQTTGNNLANQATGVVTQYDYDHRARLLDIKKKLITSFGPGANQEIIAQNTYDELGQLKTKKLAPAYSGSGLETLSFDYNIRGWLLGMNRDFVKDINTTNYFGFDLGYDKNGAIGTYNPLYNGNISGTIWKSKGDQAKRKYDFTYDATNRFMRADFTQQNGIAWDLSAGINFTTFAGNGVDPATAYDANGNMITSYKMGLKGTSSVPIDDLSYNYLPNSNKLKYVYDHDYSVGTTLGDFQEPAQNYTDNTVSGIADYAYDANGKLLSDKNKAITNIAYNYLNLPSLITITAKGTITYTYGAEGNKLRKVTTETASAANNNIGTVTTTDYLGDFVYESKVHTPAAGTDYTNKLLFGSHEEGRIRALFDNASTPNTITGFTFDYFVKDHLGNTRMVLTEETPTNIYPAASLEGTYSATGSTQVNSMINYEKQFYNIDNTKVTSEGLISFLGNAC